MKHPTSTPSGASGRHDYCLNCEAELSGPYCARCGQKVEARSLPLRALLVELADNLFTLDAQLPQTAIRLITRPGHLTNEYIAGRRARYLSPLRLYLFSSFAFFLLLALLDTPMPANPVDEEAAAAAIQQAEAELQGQLPVWLAPDTSGTAASLGGQPGFATRASQSFKHSLQRISKDPQAFAASFRERLSLLVFLLVPLFALLLKGLYYRTGRYYIQHLVFSLHLHAFVFILFSITWFLDAVGNEPVRNAAGTAYLWVLLAYLLVALRRVYAQPLSTTVFKTAALLAAYTVLFILSFASFALLVILMY